MNIQELLYEDARELNDIHRMAAYVVDFYLHYTHYNRTQPFTITQMKKITGKRLPLITSAALSKVLSDLRFELRYGLTTQWGYYNPSSHLIGFCDTLISTPQYFTQVISHELQHAVDQFKSEGKFKDPQVHKSQERDYDTYLKFSHEINARFTEMLFMLAKANPTRSELVKTINNLLDHNNLNKEYLGKGVLAEKRFQRLRSRAALFWQEYQKILSEPVPKETFWDKVKTLVHKINNSTFMQVLAGPTFD